jgi:hypothetical protein
VTEKIVEVDPLRRQELVLLAVTDGKLEVLVRRVVDDEGLLDRLERVERADEPSLLNFESALFSAPTRTWRGGL